MKRKEAKREEIIESSTKEKQQRVSKLKELEKGIGINDANYS